jgi:hypothetical protein
MFGKEFWENAILEATHWNYGSDNIRHGAHSLSLINEHN